MYVGRIFLHFLGIHYLGTCGLRYSYDELYREANLATRISILSSDEVYITAASYVESPICLRVLLPLLPLFNYGYVRLIGGGPSLERFVKKKVLQYFDNTYQRHAYSHIDLSKIPSFRARKGSATKYIINSWNHLLESDEVGRLAHELGMSSNVEKIWENVPSNIGEKAFIVENVAPIFMVRTDDNLSHSLHGVINSAYFRSFTEELKAGVIIDLNRLNVPYDIPSFGINISYSQLLRGLLRLNLVDYVISANADQLLSLREDSRWIDLLESTVGSQSPQQYRLIKARHRSLEMDEDTCDIAIFVALDEEFRELLDVIGNVTPKKNCTLGGYDYYFSVDKNDKGGIFRCVARLIGEMGPDIANAAASNIISTLQPKIIISIGIAASISDDIDLCNVVVANQIDSYASNLKAVTTAHDEESKGYQLLHRGSVYKAPHRLIENIKDFEFAHNSRYISWQEDCLREMSEKFKITLKAPQLIRAHLASGPILSSSTAFRDWLKTRDQSIKVVEMESGGIACTSWARENPVEMLSIRGISDFGDETKTKLDEDSRNIYRKAAMRNASKLMFTLISAGSLDE